MRGSLWLWMLSASTLQTLMLVDAAAAVDSGQGQFVEQKLNGQPDQDDADYYFDENFSLPKEISRRYLQRDDSSGRDRQGDNGQGQRNNAQETTTTEIESCIKMTKEERATLSKEERQQRR